jgi:hypothetical protein
MTSRKLANFRLDEELLEGLAFLKERDGIPLTEQVRRAVKMWLELKGVKGKTAKPTRTKRISKV